MMNTLQAIIEKFSGVALEDNRESHGIGTQSLQDVMEGAMGASRRTRREVSDYGVGLPPLA